MTGHVDAAWRFGRKTGLVLTAGGSRGAYQAGVLKRIGEIPALRGGPSPFPIVTGASAGAINGTLIAGGSEDFHDATRRLARLWSQLRTEQVYRTDVRALLRNGWKLGLDVVTGANFGAGRVASLLDTSPLPAFLKEHLPIGGVGRAIDAGRLYALAVTATGYHSGKSYTFIEGRKGHPLWLKSRRVALATKIGIEHVCASASIPVVFPPAPVMIDGVTAWFGDGALRLTTPMSPAIRLGANRLLAIGIRCSAAADNLTRAELAHAGDDDAMTLRRPPLSQICGVFMNAVFLDHLDADLDHLRRMNELIAAMPEASREAVNGKMREPIKVVEPLAIAPSEDLAVIANALKHRIPATVRYLLDALGTPDARSADLTSYLLFDAEYTRELIRIGYQDASSRIDEIEAFLRQPATAASRGETAEE
ncbi:patatin-like phospholipase family protein [Nevskia ramosa]|uniref:patatin-like phospholipase family protein n=1 Tax=Nevskia ramosa TaxID=64002 RepID=UPI0003B54EDE|nr:patatin-like phospholipase family protein [Nevskia ramosa]